MTKVNEIQCDVCHGTIDKRFTFLKRSRFWHYVLYAKRWWGGYGPGDGGWRQRRVDICNECWEEMIADLRGRINDD